MVIKFFNYLGCWIPWIFKNGQELKSWLKRCQT
jgi:hypothetical protein